MTASNHMPPRAAEWLLALLLPEHLRDPLLADLADAYAEPSRRHRRLWYWGQVARALSPPTLVTLHLQSRRANLVRQGLYTEMHAMPNAGVFVDSIRDDTRLALRGFRNRPLWAAMIVTTLALGIGANSTMFGLLDQLLLHAPPQIADPDRVVTIHTHRIGTDWMQSTLPYVYRSIFRDNVSDFADVAVATPTGVTWRQYFPVGRGVAATRVAGALVSGNYFSVLGARPALGRLFTAEETQEDDAQKVAVLGYRYWKQKYGGRADAIGQTIDVGVGRYTIVGVAAEGFNGTELRDVELWLPVTAADGLRMAKDRTWARSTNSEWLLVIARIKPGVRTEHAEAQATIAYRNWLRANTKDPEPGLAARLDSEVVRLGSIVPGKALWTFGGSGSQSDGRVAKLLASVAFVVLLIACANVANLLLVRALGRKREIAVRLALGVSHGRLIRQLIIEGLLLAMAGTVGALGLTAVGSQVIRRWMIGDGAWTAGAIDARIFFFTLAVGVATGVVTSLAPAAQAGKLDLASALKAGSREGSVQKSRMRTGLLVAQAALAILLLSGAGMFIRSLRNVAHLDLGVDVDHTLVAQISQGSMNLSNDESLRLFNQFADRVRQIPGVTGSAVTVALPFSMSWGTTIRVPGRTLPQLQQNPVQYAVGDQYFDVLGIHTLLGRAFTSTDRAGATRVALVNQTMARLYWPNANPIGACVTIGADTMPCTTIVGVVTNTRRQDLVEGLVPQIYRPLDQVSAAETRTAVSFFGYTLIARTNGDPLRFIEPLRRTIQATAPSVPYANVQTMRALLGRQTRAWELGARVFSAFGALALLLAGVGLFSVVAFTIGQRLHEFGVRTALGAQRLDLLRLTIVRGVSPAIAGIGAGVVLTLLSAPFLEGLLFEESPRDSATLATAAAVMLVAAVLACLVPGWRAAQVDPTIALRAD